MDFGLDQRTRDLQEALLAFLAEHVYPAEATLAAQLRERDADPERRWSTPPVVEDLKAEARRRGLWNLFLPGEHGAGLTNLQYAPLAEIIVRSPVLASESITFRSPYTGNMEVLAMFGTRAQQQRW